MKVSLLTVFICYSLMACQAQQQPSKTRQAGGSCEGCEAIYEYGSKVLTSADTLPGFAASASKLKVTGTVYQKDRRTPAGNIIVYIYHTDSTGRYPAGPDATGWGRQHGMLRGWIKTGADGRYTFYTSVPAAYPGRTEPAHIHFIVKEPHLNEYYIDDIRFTHDPLLKNSPARPRNIGGSGIVTLQKEKAMQVAERPIILGLNVRDYQ